MSAHNARLDVRLPAAHKALIDQAAEVLGQSTSAFTVSTLVAEATSVIAHRGNIQMSDRDRDRFLACLAEPPAPKAALRRAAKQHGGRRSRCATVG